MAGNSQRRGRRKEGSKKGPTIGTGGHGRQALEGRGRTLPASERPWHKAYEGGATERRRRAPARGVAKTRRPPAAAPGQELVGGRNAVLEALRAGVPATTLYVAERADIDDRLRESLRLAADTGVSVLEVPRPQLDRFAGGGSHQGVALAVPPYEYAHPDDLLARADESGQPPLVVALDSVTDPRNLGAVVRSAAAFGAHGVVVPERRAAGMSAGAWKASAGAAARIPVARAANLTRALTAYRQAGLFVVGLAADGDTRLADLDMAGEPLVVVVGSEGRGLSRLVAETCDVTVRIPMATGTESLNAGVAAGIVLYEVARARS